MDNKVFKEQLAKIGVELSDVQHRQLDRYFEILVEWNEFMNLTGITEYDEVNQKHFVDSLVLQLPLRLLQNKKVKAEYENVLNKPDMKLIDVGTGAGFPGLPIKIAYPEINVVLLDSLNKRVKFLNEVIGQLGLNEIAAVHGRAEEAARNKTFREQFDISVSRAVANLSSLVEYNLPFVRIGGYFVAYKSGNVDEEVEAAKKAVELLGGHIDAVCRYVLPDSDIERSLILIKKIKNTGGKYPRKAGMPTKEPIM
ncbi:MAG: 16S rRNA (guanine(527)-N(7))-methyltransferase RsmG [Eubacteriales bacterium]|nr:16S rRNA (guanine(527)-N(7))-methyltransferase RsmG [Eubacteriales bacterium]